MNLKKIIPIVFIIMFANPMGEARMYLKVEGSKLIFPENPPPLNSLLINIGYKFNFLGIRSKTYIEYNDLHEYKHGLFGVNPFTNMYAVGQQFRFKNGMYVNFKHYADIPDSYKTRRIDTTFIDFREPPILYEESCMTKITVGYDIEF